MFCKIDVAAVTWVLQSFPRRTFSIENRVELYSKMEAFLRQHPRPRNRTTRAW